MNNKEKKEEEVLLCGICERDIRKINAYPIFSEQFGIICSFCCTIGASYHLGTISMKDLKPIPKKIRQKIISIYYPECPHCKKSKFSIDSPSNGYRIYCLNCGSDINYYPYDPSDKKQMNLFDLNDYIKTVTVHNGQLNVNFNFPLPSKDTRDLRNKYNLKLIVEEK